MSYKLPNGQMIDLRRIQSVSTVRDMGSDSQSIEKSKIGFTIHLSNREIVDVIDYYHFNDWGEVKNKLQHLRREIIDKWEKAKQNKA